MDLLDELMRTIDPEHVPLQFIVMARITDFQGNERIVKGVEMEDLLRDPERHNVAEARVVYNVKKMRKAVLDEVDAVYDDVNRLFAQKTR